MQRIAFMLAAALLLGAVKASAETTITYQGQLSETGVPFTGTVDLEFALFTAPTGGIQISVTIVHADWPVTDGLFQVELDFGDIYFTEVWLQVWVDGNELSPRQPVTATPLAVRAERTDAGAYSGSGSGSFIGGGGGHDASGVDSTVPGGRGNAAAGAYSLAAGRRARANHGGSFVWGDSTNADFSSTAADQFLIRAGGGVGIGTGSPNSQLHVNAESGTNGLRTQIAGQTKLLVHANGGVAVGGNLTPPTNGLRVADRIGIAGTARQQLSIGPDLDLYSGGTNSPTRPSIRAGSADNLAINAYGSGSVRINFDSGTGGVRFHDGTSAGELMRLTPNGRLGIGTGSPQAELEVAGFILGSEIQSGQFRLLSQGGAGADQDLCRDSTLGYLGLCSSSRRYKTDIETLEDNGQLVSALRPVRYRWKQTGTTGLGLVAEEVAEVMPDLVTHNDVGEIEGVRYNQLTAVLVGALQEQQRENAELGNRISRLEARLEVMAQLIARRAEPGLGE